MSEQLNRIEDMLGQLIKMVGANNAEVKDIKENQKTVMQIQQDQQKILERLSIRSISQEADIAEIRRIK